MTPASQAITFADFGGEKSTVHFDIDELTAANFDANNGLMDALLTQVQNITEGVVIRRTRTVFSLGAGSGEASDPNAQRERKWRLIYEDDVTAKRYQREIPTAKLTSGAQGTLLPNSDDANMAATLWVDFKTAFDAIVTSPDDNACSLISARHVGRNT